MSAMLLGLKVDSASANQERLSGVQKGGSFTLVGAACWRAAGAHPGGSGGKRREAEVCSAILTTSPGVVLITRWAVFISLHIEQKFVITLPKIIL